MICFRSEHQILQVSFDPITYFQSTSQNELYQARVTRTSVDHPVYDEHRHILVPPTYPGNHHMTL